MGFLQTCLIGSVSLLPSDRFLAFSRGILSRLMSTAIGFFSFLRCSLDHCVGKFLF